MLKSPSINSGGGYVSSFPPTGDYFTSGQGKKILSYLAELGAKTCVIEKQYVDKDYLVDYQMFYSRSFREEGRFTRRIHFFSKKFGSEKFDDWLTRGDARRLQDCYLGFTIIKPVQDNEGAPLIGRTVLIPPSPQDNSVFATKEEKVSLFGFSLRVVGLPYQVQDRAVSACATIALWTSTQPLIEMFQLPSHSPAEISQLAGVIPTERRVFPSSGLSTTQIIEFLRSIDLDVEAILDPTMEIVSTAIRAYIGAGIPVIAALKIEHPKRHLYHAVVIAGYTCAPSGKIHRLYVHDDQIAPYSGTTLGKHKRLLTWHSLSDKARQRVFLVSLFVPVYPKIRLNFHEAYSMYSLLLRRIPRRFSTELCLSTVQKYKRGLLTRSIQNKREVLTMFMPRFLWIVRIFSQSEPIIDIIYDGASTFPKSPLTTVRYQ